MRLLNIILGLNLLVVTTGQVWRELGDKVLGKFKERPEIPVVDLSQPTVHSELGGRVIDLANGEHFDDTLRDTPDDIRPGGIVAFFGSSRCQKEYDALDLVREAESNLPHRSRLFIGRYDMDAATKRAWYKFTPERDLAKRFGITKCPQIVYFPRTCNGYTEWCVKDEGSYGPGTRILGCEDFKEQCKGLQYWDGQGSYVTWINEQVAKETEPMVNSLWGSYKFQDRFLQARDKMTASTHFRNNFVSKAVPPFTPNGFKAVDIPAELLKEITDFYYENEGIRQIEEWELTDTQNSFHETIMHRISWDENPRRDELADKYIKPILEEWSGIKGLQLTAFYGIREYTTGHFLRRHIDRTETHVISATLSVLKLPLQGTNQTQDEIDNNAWPLDFIDFNGNTVEYDHPPGKMILYESAKVPHGRSRQNPRNGGMHVGIFCHYAPPQEYMDWNAAQNFAEGYHHRFADYARYGNSQVVEPEEPVFTQQEYGFGAHDDAVGYDPSAREREERTAVFKNLDTVPRNLYWTNGDTTDIQCEEVAPMGECLIGTYPGHTFYWSAVGSDKPLDAPRAHHQIQHGVNEYSLHAEL